MPNEQCQLEQISVVLSVLSSKYEDQKTKFPDFVETADELALAFDDVWQYCPSLLKSGKMTAEAYELIASVNNVLDVMSEDKSLWSNSALSASAKWNEVRCLASKAHNELGISTNKSEIDWIQYEQ